MWDMLGGGFPLDPIHIEIRSMGVAPPRPPHMEASRMEVLQGLWEQAGLESVETREITVHRTFADFDDFWTTNLKSPALGPVVAAMPTADVQTLKSRVKAELVTDVDGTVTCAARVHAVRGYLPR
jgi:hypothetical protein